MQGDVVVLEVGAGGCKGVGGRCRRKVEVLDVDARESRGVGGRYMRR